MKSQLLFQRKTRHSQPLSRKSETPPLTSTSISVKRAKKPLPTRCCASYKMTTKPNKRTTLFLVPYCILPKGTILVECGKMLQRGTPKLGKDGKPMKDKKGKVIYEPYRIKVLNTINFKKSMHYNPFAYARHEVA